MLVIKNFVKRPQLKGNFLKVTNFIFDIIFPIECIGCGKEGEWFCQKCLDEIDLIKKQTCSICERVSKKGRTCFLCRHKTKIDGVIAACSYKNKLIREAIEIFKYKFVKDVSIPLSALIIKILKTNGELKNWYQEILLHKEIFVIVPVPLHPRRLRWRGFNQAELLAKELSKNLGIKIENKILIRSRYNTPQVEIKNRRQRIENIRDAFGANNSLEIKDKKILLIDDVCTTAATLSECAKVLKKAGASEIWGIVVARG